MSDHPREEQQNLKNLNICNDIWLDMFDWVGHAKVGLELALLSDHFDTLVDEHFKTRKWALGHLSIERDQNNGAKIVKDPVGAKRPLPLPEEPLPRNIVGFQLLLIRYIDDNVIAFFRRIRRLFESDITLNIPLGGWGLSSQRRWIIFVIEIWPLLFSGISEMDLACNGLALLREHISATILRDCSNLQSIFTSTLIAFPPDDRDEASVGQALSKWLHIPRADGRPKMLELSYPATFDWVNQLTETFLNATTSVSFIIVIHRALCMEPFEVDNLYTRERLTLQRTVNESWPWLVERGPIGKDAEALEEIHYWPERGRLTIRL